jgi:hypothetical protein
MEMVRQGPIREADPSGPPRTAAQQRHHAADAPGAVPGDQNRRLGVAELPVPGREPFRGDEGVPADLRKRPPWLGHRPGSLDPGHERVAGRRIGHYSSPAVIVPRLVVVLVLVVGAVVVDVVEDAVVVVVVGVEVEVVVDDVLVVDGTVLVDELVDVVVVELSLPLSAATTASATPSPITAATRIAISAFIPPLIPPRGGSP